ncbi:peptidase T [Pseudostreptobacillus hongkongensis]|uniref:peptidase T n=1 Tax=Pseudostreptobacillus hongkongensis TaxID=1162717 RepID=UPI00083538D1|nr:peptidase T [Pseudostreptobacillus hongkongensis]
MLERFKKYVKFETRSDERSMTIPSTPVQYEFAKMLADDLRNIGLENVYINEFCFVNGTLPSNIDKKVPVVGFISHMDTADFEARNVKPNVIENYDGKDIVLNKELDKVMRVSEFPNLKNYVGKTLITTDGTTLLGADDKAGIVEIVEAMKYLIEHPEIPHGEVKVAFGPDEEIGRGADKFNVKEFGADYAYTMDGGEIGELQYESFNAAQIKYEITGVSVHPGTAKDKMINANTVAAELASMFPVNEVPERTSGYEGFYLLHNMEARIEKAELIYIIRDFDKKKFEERKAFCVECANKINEKYGNILKYDMFDQYYNMGDIIKDKMYVVEIAEKAMNNLDITPKIIPIRGGTDGSKISFMGLPTPNIFVGGENFHGEFEFSCLDDMQKAKELIVEIVKLNAK